MDGNSGMQGFNQLVDKNPLSEKLQKFRYDTGGIISSMQHELNVRENIIRELRADIARCEEILTQSHDAFRKDIPQPASPKPSSEAIRKW